MIISPLLAIALLNSTVREAPQGDSTTINVGSETIVTPWPASTGNWDNLPTVSIGGANYIVHPNGNLGPRVTGPNGWKAVKEKFGGIAADPNRPFRVQVFVFSDVLLLNDLNSDPARRRSTFFNQQLTEIKQALALTRAAARVATNGLDIQYTLSSDDDVLISQEDSSESSVKVFGGGSFAAKNLSRDLILNYVPPYVNDQRFESDDPTYRGPFDAVWVIHSGLSSGYGRGDYNGVPVTTIPFYTVSPEKSPGGLANFLFEIWRKDFSERVSGFGSEMLLPDIRFLPSEPMVGAALDTQPVDSIIGTEQNWKGVPVVVGRETNRGGIAYSPNEKAIVDRLSQGGSVRTEAFAFNRSEGDGKTPVEILAPGATAPAMPAEADAVGGALPIKLRSVGDFQISESDGAFKIKREGIGTRGYAVIAERQFKPIVPGGGVKTISFELRSSDRVIVQEPYSLVMRTNVGVLYFPVSDPMMPGLTDQWKKFSFALPEGVQIMSIWLGPSQDAEFIGRYQNGAQNLEMRGIRFGNDPVTENGLDLSFLELCRQMRQSSGPLSGDEWGKLNSKIEKGNQIEQLYALHVLNHRAYPGAMERVFPIARSANDSLVPYAIGAIKRMGTPESEDALKTVVMRGPFEVNYKVAAQAMWGDPFLSTRDVIDRLSVLRSWRLRKTSIDLIPDDKNGQILLVSAIQDFNPIVRRTVVNRLDPNHELSARRMLFVAVNDSSEDVRLAAGLRLIDCEIPELRSETIRVIRDENVRIRRQILQKVVSNPSAKYRDVLQLAMIDTNPSVLKIALEAWQVFPEDVEPGEIQTAFATKDEGVMIALLKMAKAKKVSVPESTLTTASGMSDAVKQALASYRG